MEVSEAGAEAEATEDVVVEIQQLVEETGMMGGI